MVILEIIILVILINILYDFFFSYALKFLFRLCVKQRVAINKCKKYLKRVDRGDEFLDIDFCLNILSSTVEEVDKYES